MKGPYLANIGQKNHVLEKAKQKLICQKYILLNLILNLDISKFYPCKVKK